MIVDVFAELFIVSFLFNRFSCYSSSDCGRGELSLSVDCFCNCNSCLFVSFLALYVSLRMAGLLEVAKVFVDLHGRSKSRMYLYVYFWNVI